MASVAQRDNAALFAVFVAALALRPQLLAIGPILPLIRDDLALSHAEASLLVAIPLASMGVFAFPVAAVVRRVSAWRALTVCLCILVSFSLLRPLAATPSLLLVATLGIGVGIGLGGALLPVFIKQRFAEHPAFASGLVANGFQLGSAVAGGLIAPLALLMDSWRTALFVVSGVALPVPLLWFILARHRAGPAARAVAGGQRLPWFGAVVLLLIASFALRSVIFQCLAAWLPSIYVERGWSQPAAGGLGALLIVMSMPTTFVVSSLADRVGTRRQYLVGSSTVLCVAVAGFVWLPATAVLWTMLAGAAIGVLFPLGLTLPLDVAAGQREAASLTAAVLGGGYSLAAIGPVAVGVLRDATGSFGASLLALLVLAMLLLIASAWLSPARLSAHRGIHAP